VSRRRDSIRWNADDIRRIAVLREQRFTWRRVADEFTTTEDAVKAAWSYWWRQSLRRYERTLQGTV
jgi:hypothetical protein